MNLHTTNGNSNTIGYSSNNHNPPQQSEEHSISDTKTESESEISEENYPSSDNVSELDFSPNEPFFKSKTLQMLRQDSSMYQMMSIEQADVLDLNNPNQSRLGLGENIPSFGTYEFLDPGLKEFAPKKPGQGLYLAVFNSQASVSDFIKPETVEKNDIPQRETNNEASAQKLAALEDAQKLSMDQKPQTSLEIIEEANELPNTEKLKQIDLDLGVRMETHDILQPIRNLNNEIQQQLMVVEQRQTQQQPPQVWQQEQQNCPLDELEQLQDIAPEINTAEILDSLVQEAIARQEDPLEYKLDILTKKPKNRMRNQRPINVRDTNDEENYSGKKAPEESHVASKLTQSTEKRASNRDSDADREIIESPTKQKNKGAPKQDSKNIVKNYGKAMCSFALDVISAPYRTQLLELHDISHIKFKQYISYHKDKIDNIGSLRDLLLPTSDDPEDAQKIKKVFRALSEVFVRDFAINWIFSSRSNHKGTLLKYKYVVLRRVQNPSKFLNLKESKA